ncbi:hypothetical protein BSK59_15755 [Paenibacillus odorifer]|uniref:helix-turn-helix domain-containing protein n=1 Tax=Paenibacillus odorifer TaxID=189426 RepID=UPI00096C94A6|nr:helix-turn-helix transcriptional regulator [Paenibacillus odorifer]OME54035.1 hypothetical protein BSK59_15755 [Paenibacillus odorifer]
MTNDDKDKPKNDFGMIIHQKRKDLKLTLQFVADYCDVSVNFVSLVERGVKSPSDKVVLKLAEVLD